MSRRAVVALSGGQDSATCLAWALREFGEGNVEAISFNYGQRHDIELVAARQVAEHFNVPWTVVPINSFTVLGHAALTNPAIAVSEDGAGNTWAEKRELPSTFVPGRNLILLGLTAAFALPRGADHVVTGVCSTDEAGYPDCRPTFVANMERAVYAAMDAPEFQLHAPLLYLTKAETFALADQLGVLDTILELTHTCYEGEHETRHDWGYGCGTCPACKARAHGWEEFRAAQPA
jgi:7-cyano-7-deazaguanine synthase